MARKLVKTSIDNRQNRGSTTTTTDTVQLGHFATRGMYSS